MTLPASRNLRQLCTLTALFLACAHAAVKPLAISQTRYELRSGEPAEFAAPAETLDFLLHAVSRSAEFADGSAAGLVLAPSSTGERLLLAAPARVEPGEYTVQVTATSQTGETRQVALSVLVKPRAGIPSNAKRPPVVLLNGWIAGFDGTCPVANSSAETFGNLANYLVADGVPAVYLFDNCLEDAGKPVETLAADLASYLKSIKYDNGAQVPQIDLVAHSMGGLIARAYLSGLQANQSLVPPATTLVRKLVLIATPNFGSFVAGNYSTSLLSGSQGAELIPGSALLWNLATWNQLGDDLRGVDAIAIAGNAGTYTPSLSSSVLLQNASDGFVSLTSASLGFVAQQPAVTRVVPYCHVDPAAFANSSLGIFACSAPGIANVTATSHPTSQIVRSFLAGTTDWKSIGTAADADAYLSKNGGMYFTLVNSAGAYLSDVTAVQWGTVALTNGGDAGVIYYGDFLFGNGQFLATSTAAGRVNCGSVVEPAQFFTAARCKIGTAIASVGPLNSGAAHTINAGTTITITGATFGSQCSGCQVSATAAGSTTSQVLTITSWSATEIKAALPASLTGMLTITVRATNGTDSIAVMAVTPAILSAAPASLTLQYAYLQGGSAPAAQSIQISNTGSGALSWTATAKDAWLTLSAASGTAPATLTVTAIPGTLAPGTYASTVTITAASATNSPITFTVTLTVSTPPAILVAAPLELNFQYTYGSALPPSPAITIANGGGGTLSWTAAASDSWIILSTASGTAPGSLVVAFNPANLAQGTYLGSIQIAADGADGSPATVAVTLVVQGAPPAPVISAVGNAGSFQPGVASGTWISVFGTHLSAITYSWQSTDFVHSLLPTTLQGVSVTVNGMPAYVAYISPTQINLLAPDDASTGNVQVQVTTAQQASNNFSAAKTAYSPAFFTYGAGAYVAALHSADYSLVSTAQPAKPGETILLYGTGFGPSTPALPSSQLVPGSQPLAAAVQVTVGGVPATVSFAGIVSPGLCQFNITLPALPAGDAAVVATLAGNTTQSGVSITIQP